MALVPNEREAAQVREAGLADEVVIADARNPVAVADAVGKQVDVTVVCVDVPGCEHGAILATADGGTVIFFSMATSFSAAALGAEGLAADVEMLVGNGYVPGHAAFALDLFERGRVCGRCSSKGRLRDVSTQLSVGGRIYAPDASAMAVTDGVIVWIGQDSVGRALHPDASVIELNGAFVAPAFVDAHVHATSAGLLLTGLDLTRTSSWTNCSSRCAPFEGDLVWGHGWDETRWPENRPPTRAEIDEAAGGTDGLPVAHRRPLGARVVERWSTARGAWKPTAIPRTVRSRARRTTTCEGRARPPSPPNNVRPRNSRSCVTLRRWASPRARVRRARHLRRGRPGRTAGLSGEGPEVVAYWGAHDLPSVPVRGLAGDHFVDGAVGSRTAALTAPYADADTSGALYLDGQQIADHLVKCTEAGMQAGFHVIGDAAVGRRDRRLRHRREGRRHPGARPPRGTGSNTSRWCPPSRPSNSPGGA